jgi:hypothetical protein
MLRTFLVFFVGGWLLAAAALTFVLAGGMIWMDCFHDNRGHVCGDALLFILVAPFYGIGLAMSVCFVPVIVGALFAVLSQAVFRRVPMWYAMAILPVCVLAYFAQGAPWLAGDSGRPLSERLLMVAGIQAAALLLICWRLDREESAARRVITGLDQAINPSGREDRAAAQSPDEVRERG